MLALAVRELIVAARRPAVPLAACTVGTLLTGFVLVWSPGISVLAPMNLYEQTRLLHWVLLAAALPWTAVRSAPGERGDDFVLMAAFTGLRPATVIAAKTLALTALLVLVELTGLPALVLAQQSAAVPVMSVLTGLLPLVGLAMLVTASSTASVLVLPGPLGSWLMSTAAVVSVLLTTSHWAQGVPALGLAAALIGFIGAGWVRAWSTSSLKYLGESRAQ